MSQLTDVSIIGLGSMGWGAAMSLLWDGIIVHGVDIRPEILEQFSEKNGKPCATPGEAARHVKVVMIFVVNEEQTEQVLFGQDGAVAAAEPGTLFINSSTIAPSAVVKIGDRLLSAGMLFLDAPVFGGAARALRGEVTVMASGSAEAFGIASPVFDAISVKVTRLGNEIGQASRMKLVNQLLSDIHIAATAEAMTLASKLGIDLERMYEVITKSTGNSWMFENRGSHIVSGDYAPRSAIDIIVKDLGIAHLEAQSVGAETPMTSAALALFSEANAEGYGGEDGSAVAKLLAEKSDVLLPGVKKKP